MFWNSPTIKALTYPRIGHGMYQLAPQNEVPVCTAEAPQYKVFYMDPTFDGVPIRSITDLYPEQTKLIGESND